MVGDKELLGLVLSEDDSGINVMLSLDLSSSSMVGQKMIGTSPTQPITVAMYLAKSECTEDLQFTTGSSFISYTSYDVGSVNGTSVLNVGFDGPSPLFLQPSTNGTTMYCLMINSSIPFSADNSQINISAQFIKRGLTGSTINLTPKYAIYSSVFGADYAFYDQWGVPFISSSQVDLYCENETISCGHTNAGSSTGRVLLSFNDTVKPNSWVLYKRVSASLSVPHSQPATAYGTFNECPLTLTTSVLLLTIVVGFWIVISFNIIVLLIGVILVGWVGWVAIRRFRNWRSEFKNQKLLLEERDKQILELQRLWKVNPASIEWIQLLSK